MSEKTKIAVLLAERGITQGDLARLIGMQRSNLNLIITGKTAPALLSALKIADAMGVAVDDLWTVADLQDAPAAGGGQ